jgi:LytS/YehU family sensor histidine kinase
LLHQMNPHFIFNSMSTIQNLIIHHDIEKCLEYIATLSRLMRAMLQNSRQETISLENELKFIQQYIDLELIRYQNSFDVNYELHLNSEDISEIHIPTMMIQPILENAIKHGVSNLEDRRGNINMNISFDTSGSYLAIKVEDNGYGVPIENNHPSHVSTAIDIIKERLNIYQVDNRNGTYQMNSSREGTIVEMKIPI